MDSWRQLRTMTRVRLSNIYALVMKSLALWVLLLMSSTLTGNFLAGIPS